MSQTVISLAEGGFISTQEIVDAVAAARNQVLSRCTTSDGRIKASISVAEKEGAFSVTIDGVAGSVWSFSLPPFATPVGATEAASIVADVLSRMSDRLADIRILIS